MSHQKDKIFKCASCEYQAYNMRQLEAHLESGHRYRVLRSDPHLLLCGSRSLFLRWIRILEGGGGEVVVRKFPKKSYRYKIKKNKKKSFFILHVFRGIIFYLP